jgi:hypothetical protein
MVPVSQIQVSKQTIAGVFEQLPLKYKLLLTNADIKFVLDARNQFDALSQSPVQNITAFLDVMQYIKREASRVRNNISDEAIQVILNAEMR